MESFRVCLVQMRVEKEREANFARARAEIEAAALEGARLVVLPEMFSCPYDVESFPRYAEEIPAGPSAAFLSGIAATLEVYLVGGSIPEAAGGKIYNTSTLWGPTGELLLTHRKVHLFDVDIPGGISFRESACLSAGNQVSVVQTELGTIGLAICFDLRFPEQFRAMALAGAELFVLPGAFNTTTGPVHWESLNRARAIENTCYLAACSPAPHPAGGYPAWGHSMIVDPWGDVLEQCGREVARVSAVLDSSRLEDLRRSLPVLRQRRPEVYGL